MNHEVCLDDKSVEAFIRAIEPAVPRGAEVSLYSIEGELGRQHLFLEPTTAAGACYRDSYLGWATVSFDDGRGAHAFLFAFSVAGARLRRPLESVRDELRASIGFFFLYDGWRGMRVEEHAFALPLPGKVACTYRNHDPDLDGVPPPPFTGAPPTPAGPSRPLPRDYSFKVRAYNHLGEACEFSGAMAAPKSATELAGKPAPSEGHSLYERMRRYFDEGARGNFPVALHPEAGRYSFWDPQAVVDDGIAPGAVLDTAAAAAIWYAQADSYIAQAVVRAALADGAPDAAGDVPVADPDPPSKNADIRARRRTEPVLDTEDRARAWAALDDIPDDATLVDAEWFAQHGTVEESSARELAPLPKPGMVACPNCNGLGYRRGLDVCDECRGTGTVGA